MKTTKEHLANFYIAGFTYYDAPLCFSKLKIGTHLRLKLEKDNKFDARAVAIYYKDFKLGFVPRAENRIFYKLLITGHKKKPRLYNSASRCNSTSRKPSESNRVSQKS